MRINLLFPLILLSLISCHKEKKENYTPSYSYINETLKADYSLNTGSYWVYENQNFNTDSIVLHSVHTGFTGMCPDNACSKNEFIKLNFRNETKGVDYNHYLLSDHIKYNGGGDWGQEGQPIYIINQLKDYEFNGLVVGDYYDSLLILNTMFYRVIKMKVKANQQIDNQFKFDRDFYFSPHIGVVKYVIYDTSGTETFNLKNYNVE